MKTLQSQLVKKGLATQEKVDLLEKENNYFEVAEIIFDEPYFLGKYRFKMSGLCEIYKTLSDGRNYRNTKRTAGPGVSVKVTVFGTPNQLNAIEKGERLSVKAYLTRKKITEQDSTLLLDNLDLCLYSSNNLLDEIKVGERLSKKANTTLVADPIQGGFIFSV